MLAELPNQFQADKGGGWSFLSACDDRNGHQWTDYHQRMEQLFQLGLALGLVRCPVPRDAWSMLPGSMPYYVVDVTGEWKGPTLVPPTEAKA